MKTKTKVAKIALFFLCIMLIIPSSSWGASSYVSGVKVKSINDTLEDNEEIKSLNQEISSKKDTVKKIQDKQETYRKAIEEKRAERVDLNNQLSILENRIAQTELDISKVKTEIDTITLEIKKTTIEINATEESILGARARLEKILRLIYKQDNITALEVILLNNSFSDYVNQMKYLEDINAEVKATLDDLKDAKKILNEKKVTLTLQDAQLEKSKQELEEKKKVLESELENKTYILEQTEIAEYSYQNLLARAKLEQEAASADIVSLERKVRDRISQLEKNKLQFNDSGFIWPVPKNIITSAFHDPDYPFRFIFEHPAIDIRAAQGTTIRAPASGYVARAKDGGKGYSYIMLIHGDGLSTVFGHVSRINVNEDDYVVQGQAIGKSGGLPGTPGAGSLTTGPHLHFEVRLNGIPVNPMEYLP